MRKLMPLVMAVTLLFAAAQLKPVSGGIIQPGDGAVPTPTPTPDPENPTTQSTPTDTDSTLIEIAISIAQGLLAVL